VPAAAPPVPAGYCSSVYNELYGDVQAFNTLLATPPTWTPISGPPTVYGANLQWADGNTGPSLSSPTYMPTVLAQLQELQALGITAVSVPVLFPILYEPFYGSQAAYQPYLTFYTQVAQAVRAAGLTLIIDNEILFSNSTEAGWSNMNAFYSGLTWPQYIAARAQMAATVAQVMQPDYLMLANEPDTEATQTGQPNLNIAVDAAQMVAAEIAAVQALGLATVPKMGAGFGTWMSNSGAASLLSYTNAYTALPLDYIDYHVLTINTVQSNNFLTNALTVSSMAAAAGKPVAVSQAWITKASAGEWNTLNFDQLRARQPFSFWAPLDSYFLQTMQTLANYTQMLYMVPEQPTYFSAYQTYGGTGANGGAANCTCTTASCSDFDITQAENSVAIIADTQSEYTTVALSYYNQLVTTPDPTPPSAPTNLAGVPATAGANLTWTASTDNVGVAGYNVFRCAAPAPGQPCAGVWIANSTLPAFSDSGLASNTLYNYQVQAFDVANNLSPMSAPLSLQTYRTAADSATSLLVTAVSSQEIDLSWSPPSNATGLGQYLIYAGTSASNLQQIAIAPSGVTSYRNVSLSAASTYYYGIVAVEEGISSGMTSVASATTMPLPNPPTSVVGTPTASAISLAWQDSPQANGLPISYYQVFQGTTSGKLAKVASTSNPSYGAASLSAGTTYYFEVVAVDTNHGDSTPSDQISVTTPPVPAAPVGVLATANSDTQVTVSWSESIPANGLPIQNYNIFRGTSPTAMVQLTARTGTQFIDTGASPNTNYYYAIEAVDNGGDVSPMSAAAEVSALPMPSAPASVGATATSGTLVAVVWSESVPVNGLPIQSYNIFRGTSPTGLIQLTARTGLQFSDTGVSPNTTYYYAIQAVDTGGDISPISATAQAATPSLPAAPTSVLAIANDATQVTVTWAENVPANGLPIQYYNIMRGISPGVLTKLTSRTGLQFIDTGVSANITYYYSIEAIDTGNAVSPASGTAQVATP
jgi:fibronectin type 3 domain-containing protein